MKIQLKRSNVLETNAAKEPAANQLEFGELAVNYNDADPAIFLKTSNNQVVRISGVGNVADDGQVELPASVSPPNNPKPGNLWFNSDDGRLYIYYKDADTEQWVDASPDSWDPSGLPDFSDPNIQPESTFDQRYVNAVGDNMTGDLTLGTDKITLNATDGSAEFAGAVNAVQLQSLGDTANPFTYFNSGGYYANSNVSNETFRLTAATGNAEFAGNVEGGSSTTSYGISGNNGTNGNSLWQASVTGRNYVSGGPVWAGLAYDFTADNTKVTSSIFEDGSAEFKGEVDSPRVNLKGTSTENILAGYAGTTNTWLGTADAKLYLGNIPGGGNIVLDGTDGSAEFAGVVNAVQYSSLGDPNVPFTYFNAGGYYANSNGSTETFRITAATGNAEFAGQIRAKELVVQNPGVSQHSLLDEGVSLYTTSPAADAKALRIRSDNGGSAIEQCVVYGNGDAYFRGNATLAGPKGIVFNLEPDNDDNYTVTTDVDEEGNTVETRVYNGPTMDVKDHLTRTQAALMALKTAAQDNATDLAGLKAAIVVALANI